MSWLSSFLQPSEVAFKVREVRFTQGDARLHSVSVTLSTSTQNFSSKSCAPQPVDPVSYRNKVSWPDTELRIDASEVAFEEIKITLTNRRRRVRTTIGAVKFSLASLNPPIIGEIKFMRKISLKDTLFPSLNLKLDLEVELINPGFEGWLACLPMRHRLTLGSETPSSYRVQNSSTDSSSDNPSTPSMDNLSVSNDGVDLIQKSSVLRFEDSNPAIVDTSPKNGDWTNLRSSQGLKASSGDSKFYDHITSSSNTTSTEKLPPLADENSDTESIASFESIVTHDTSIGMAKPETDQRGFEFGINTDYVGVVFLEIVSITNLPKFKSLTGISFDMDPFVVMGFGRRVYKTPHRRHTLNPQFNCKVAFEVGKMETTFSIVFTVWDQDKITLNDRVGEVHYPISRIMNETLPKCDPDSKIYDFVNHSPSVIILPVKHSAGTAELMIKVHYYPMAAVRQQMWRGVIDLYAPSQGELTYDQLKALLNSLGSTLSDDMIIKFFTKHGLDFEKDVLRDELVIAELERIVANVSSERVILFRICPICHQKPHGLKKNNRKKKLLEHLSHCASTHWAESTSLLLDNKYVSTQQASQRWYSKILSKCSYGSYKLGAYSANILVQDRISGHISEEKMATSVRLAIRIIYLLGPVERRKFQTLLRQYTIKQGIKYSHPSSKTAIEPFIKFHNLDMSEVLLPVTKFNTFNEFFYRRLKPGSRPCENHHESGTVVSMADSRYTVFNSIDIATKLWIKGKNFTITKLLGSKYGCEASKFNNGSLMIFRLAPQDYHRVHCPVNGTLGEPDYIVGQYYTVNPMAIRSSLDVFGENTRVVYPIDSPDFGRVMVVMVGATMVGSCVFIRKAGEQVKRTEELGYFQFGGSTVVLIFEPNKFVPDRDLEANSLVKIETLVKVGMSVGHKPGIPEFVRSYDTRHCAINRAKSLISGGGSYLPFSLD